MQAVLSGAIDQYSREREFLAKDGSLVPALASVIVVREHGDARRLVAFVVDQREQKRVESALRASEERLTQLALHDDLTGLPNRRLLFTRCTEVFATAREAGVADTIVAALFIDLDGFKPINDMYGHDRGDQLLVDIARDLCASVGDRDTVARVGGDEFVVLLDQHRGSDHLTAVAERITAAVRRTVGAGLGRAARHGQRGRGDHRPGRGTGRPARPAADPRRRRDVPRQGARPRPAPPVPVDRRSCCPRSARSRVV